MINIENDYPTGRNTGRLIHVALLTANDRLNIVYEKLQSVLTFFALYW